MSCIALRHALSAALILLIVTTLPGGVTAAAPSYQTPTPTPQPQSQPTRPILLTDPVPDSKQQGVLYFPATGHTLRGAFLNYWNRYGGLAQFGYPLTEEFFEPVGPDNKMYRLYSIHRQSKRLRTT